MSDIDPNEFPLTLNPHEFPLTTEGPRYSKALVRQDYYVQMPVVLQVAIKEPTKMVALSDVEHLIISAIEDTETPDRMREQSDLWEKVYAALEVIRGLAKEIEVTKVTSEINPALTK